MISALPKLSTLRFFLPILFLLHTPLYGQSEKSGCIKVLIVDGFSNHDWKQTTKEIKKILGKAGMFCVSVSTAPERVDDTAWTNWDPEFKNYDVVIQNTNNIQNPKWHWPEKIEKELEEYVSGGGGLYIFHSANNAFENWPAYNQMIGMGWRSKDTGFAPYIDKNGTIKLIPPGEGSATYHGNRSDILVHKLNSNPINRDFPDEWMTPDIELYKYARGPAKNITILSYAYDKETNKNWPVDWVVKYFKGNVYVSSMGHLWSGDIYPISYRSVDFETLLIRVTEWLAKSRSTYPLPSNFPDKFHISIDTEPDTAR